MNDFRPLGKAIPKKVEPVPDKLVPDNKSGTVVVDKSGRFQTRGEPLGPRFKPTPPVVDLETD